MNTTLLTLAVIAIVFVICWMAVALAAVTGKIKRLEEAIEILSFDRKFNGKDLLQTIREEKKKMGLLNKVDVETKTPAPEESSVVPAIEIGEKVLSEPHKTKVAKEPVKPSVDSNSDEWDWNFMIDCINANKEIED